MNRERPNSFRLGPDEHGHFGVFGGRFVAETLMPLILDLERHYEAARVDPAFKAELAGLLTHYVGRPSPLYYAERMTEDARRRAAAAGLPGGAKIYFKREELNHTGAHKINNVIGQILLARRMGKTRIIAETGAGQHGVAAATACARFGLECIVYMGAVDVERQKPQRLPHGDVGRQGRAGTGRREDLEGRDERSIARLGHQCRRHVLLHRHGGGGRIPIRPWCAISNASSARETRVQMQAAEGRLPDSLFACIGGGSNAIGLFHPFLDERDIEIYGRRGRGLWP